MNNFEITQKIIFEKLSNHRSEEMVVETKPGDSATELDKAYYFLNGIIDAQNITSARPVVSKRKGLVAKCVIIIKKVIRKLLFWYIEPICKQQTKYNELCTQYCIHMFYNAQREKANTELLIVEELQKRNSELNDKIETFIKKTEESQAFIDELLEKTEESSEKVEEVQKKIEKLQNENEILRKMLVGYIQDNAKQSVEIKDLANEISNIQQNTDKYECMSKETEKVISDMQTIKRENADLFKPFDSDFWNKVSVAQSGEDTIVEYVLMVLGINLSDEYYLDLGANHAKQLSNTYMLYKKGMRGVLVEANPQLIGELKFYRSEDVILNKCISNHSDESLQFYIMSGDGLSCTSMDAVNEMIEKNPQLYIKETITVDTITVNQILQKYFSKAPILLSIDIEGQEESILQTLDYNKYAPLIVIVERIDYGTTIATRKRQDLIADIMNQNGYFEYAFTGINSIFINKRRLEEIQNENSI